MRLVEQHIIKRSSVYYNELQDLRVLMLRSLRNPIPQNVVSWITSRFVSMINMPEDVSNEDCSKHLPVVLLTPISMVLLTSSENRQKKPSM